MSYFHVNREKKLLYMTGFMKTVSTLRTKTAICTSLSQLLKALKSLQAIKKKKKLEGGEQEKEDKRVEEKKTDIPFNFYIIFFA